MTDIETPAVRDPEPAPSPADRVDEAERICPSRAITL